MRLITKYELAVKSKTELSTELKTSFNALAQSQPQSAQRRNALASIENIQRELNSRAPRP